MDDHESTLGQRMRQRRTELRVWQRDLAAVVGLSSGYLSDLEHDAARATAPTLRRLALALSLDEFALVEQATREERLAPKIGGRGRRTVEPADVPPSRSAPAARTAPQKSWLTTAEAAAAMGVTADAVRSLLHRGRVGPAYRVHLAGEKGPKRWIVSAEAAMAYRSPSEGYAKPTRAEPPGIRHHPSRPGGHRSHLWRAPPPPRR